MGDFVFPEFHSYPPYFTVQPNKETQDKQLALWADLVLQYCQHSKHYILDLDAANDLFENTQINRKLSPEGRCLVCQRLVDAGRAEWVDKSRRSCLLLWLTLQQWAAKILGFAKANALTVMVLDDLSSGEEVEGTDLEGVPVEILRRALQLLEKDGKVTFITTGAGEGVKFV